MVKYHANNKIDLSILKRRNDEMVSRTLFDVNEVHFDVSRDGGIGRHARLKIL